MLDSQDHTPRQADRRHWRRRGSSWLALLLLTFRPSRPPCRRTGWERRARLAQIPRRFNLVTEM
jgi:hypothetical protein